MTNRSQGHSQPAGRTPAVPPAWGNADHVARLRDLIATAFPAQLDDTPDGSHAFRWLTVALEKGLTRVYALNLAACLDPMHHARLVELVGQRTGDAEAAARLSEVLHVLAEADPPEPAALATLLLPVIAEGIDQVTQRAQAAGRDAAGVHCAALRVGSELVVLIDAGPQYQWLLSSVENRLRDALAKVGCELNPSMTQAPELLQGESFEFLGNHVRLVWDRGKPRVQCRRVGSEVWDGADDAPMAVPSVPQPRTPERRRTSDAPAPAASPAPEPAVEEEVEEESLDHPVKEAAKPVPVPAVEPEPPEEPPDAEPPFVLVLAGYALDFLRFRIPHTSAGDFMVMGRFLARRWRWAVPLLAVSAVLLVVYVRGGAVAGTVTYQSQPVERGWVLMYPQSPGASPKTSVRIEQGSYRLRGLERGSYELAVLAPDIKTSQRVSVHVGYLTTTRHLDVETMVPVKGKTGVE